MLDTALDSSVLVFAWGESSDYSRHDLGPEVTRIIRFADPAAWMIAKAAKEALAHIRNLPHLARDVGVISMSAEGPRETRDLVASISREHKPSALKFPAANPGSIIAVACSALQIHGPTINFTMPVPRALEAALPLAAYWLRSRSVPAVLVVAWHQRSRSVRFARVASLVRPIDGLTTKCSIASTCTWLSAASLPANTG